MTNTYLTGNPLGSTSPKDLYDNASNLDEGLNSPSPSFTDRFGKRRQTWTGFETAVATALIQLGYVYTTPLDYQAGIILASPNQVFRRSGEYYRAGPSLALPYTLTGDWGTEGPLFVSVGDAALRSELAASTGAGMIGYGASTVDVVLDGLVGQNVPVFPGEDIQSAIDQVNTSGGGAVTLFPGVHNVTSTIILFNNVALRGSGGTSTVIYRTGSYGDTVYQETGFCRISDLFFQHGTNDPEGSVALDFRLTDGSAHIRLKNTQNALIRNCITWRMPYGIVSDGGHNTKVENTWLQGTWDPSVPGKQEGIADIRFTGTDRHGQLGKVLNCYLSGAPGPVRNTTFTDGVNNVTVNIVSNIGSKSNMYIDSMEDLDCSGTYFGRASYSLLHLNPQGPNGIVADIRINHAFFDNAGSGSEGRQILVDTIEAGKYVLGLTVNNSTFNGEYDTNNALLVAANTADSKPSVVNFAFTGNNLLAHTATPLVLFGVGGGTVSGNTFTNWNSVQAGLSSSVNATVISPIYIGADSFGVSVYGNTLGGGGNNAGDVSNYCYSPVLIEPLSVGSVAKNNNYIGLNSAAGIRKGFVTDEQQVIATVSANYQMLSHDSYYERNFSSGSVSTVNLPVRPIKGQEVIIKDGKGDAASLTFQIGTADGTTIDGASTTDLTENWGFRRFRFNGSSWRRIA